MERGNGGKKSTLLRSDIVDWSNWSNRGKGGDRGKGFYWS
jgi:hypothetical protein